MVMATQLQELQLRVQAELAVLRESLAPPASRRISAREKRFTLPDGASHEGPIHAVILDHRNLNRYYSKPFDSSHLAPPDCFAIAKRFEDLSPRNHDEVKAPLAAECATCVHNQFGSALNGKGKACRNAVRLAITPPNPDARTTPMTLELPPSALKNWNRFVGDLEATGLLPIQVVAEISFDPAKSYPCPTFKILGPHDDLHTLWSLRECAAVLLDQAAIS